MDWMSVMHEILGSTDYRQLLVCWGTISFSRRNVFSGVC